MMSVFYRESLKRAEKTNKSKVTVKAVWQKHAIATVMESSGFWTRDFTVKIVDLSHNSMRTPNASQIPVTNSLNHDLLCK